MSEPSDNYNGEKSRRSITMIAALGIVLIAGGAIGGVAYDAVVSGNSASVAQLGTFGTLALGALIALAGGKKDGN